MHVSSSPKFWDGINEKFYSKYSGLDKWHKDMARDVTEGKLIVTPFGREYLIPMKEYRGERQIPWTVLSNYPVQGTGADIMMIVRISFARRLKASGIKAIMVSTVHDSIVLDVENELDIQALVDMFYGVFDDLLPNFQRLFGIEWVVPLTCECKYGLNMKEMKKIARSS